MARGAARVVTLAVVGVAVPWAGGCVEAFDGSNLQIDFAMGVPAASRPGRPLQPDQPPADTHFELYAADLVYQLDAEGNPVLDDHDRPVVVQSFVFPLTRDGEPFRFEIRPSIDRSSPCFIELGDTRFPGLHVTQIVDKVGDAVEAVAGTRDPFAAGLDPDLVTDLLNAGRRFELLEKFETNLKVVSSHQAFKYPSIGAVGACPPAAGLIPEPLCRDDASNAQRLTLCRGLWADHPDFYEGSDKVFTLPLNGRYLGMVEGMNPANDGFVGGSSMFVDENLVGHDAYVLNWQYDDFNGDGAPDFPTSVPAAERLDRGYLYMQGAPQEISRGVITVPLRHPTNSNIFADLAILPNLGHDDVHF